MTLLPDGDASFNGVQMGASSSTGITWDRIAGLTDQPRSDDPPTRLHDAAVPAWAKTGWRQITASGIQVEGDEKLRDLRAAMADRETLSELTFHDKALTDDEDLMIACVADRCEYDRGAAEFFQREYQPSVQWAALDSTIFSAVAGDQSFGGGSGVSHADLTVVNAGTFASPSGRAWTLRIQAHGTVTSPYIRVGPEADSWLQSVSWRGLTMTGGQVLEVDVNRSSWIGSIGKDGYVRSDDSDFPDWPILVPGSQVFRVGCVSGLVSGNLHPRSTW